MPNARILNALSDDTLSNLLLDGFVGVIPTDTVYGLVCCANNQKSVKRLYQLKSREKKPGTVISSSIEELEKLGLKGRYLKAVQQFWPGEISVIIPCGPELEYLDMGLHSLAVRVTSNKTLNALMNITGPLLTSSANLPGEPPANTVTEAQKYFGDDIDFYVDGNDLSNRLPSTVIRIIDDAIEVLREGSVKIDNQTGRIIN